MARPLPRLLPVIFNSHINRRKVCCGVVAAVTVGGASAYGDLSVSKGVFTFSNWDGPPLKIHYSESPDAGPNAPIVFVMHGAGRNADEYRDNWIDVANQYGLRVYAPEFDKKRFPKSRDYQTGGLTKDKDKAFTAIEPLFDAVIKRTGSLQTQYYIFGHSAGGQFVHRYVFFWQAKRIKYALAANSGWYTLPTKTAKWPYGLSGLKSERFDQDNILSAPLVVLLGDQDTDPNSHNLRQTPEAKTQGPNRFMRGLYFLKTGLNEAKAQGITLGWSYKIIEGVGHDNRGIAPTAAAMIDAFHKLK